MRKWSRRILAMCLAGVLALSCTGPVFAEDMPPMEMPGGMPGGSGGAAAAAVTFRCQEGPWSFVLTVEGDTRTSTITGWDKAQGGEIVIVPAYLGGGRVTAISSTAFSAASNVKALYLPDTVETIAAFAFYDLNSLQYISCGNPNVVIDGQALASCNSQEIQTTGTPVWVNIENSPAAAVAGGSYLVGDNAYAITLADIAAISAGDYSITSSAIVFTGDAYKPQSTEKPVKIARSLKEEVQENDFRYTFRNLTDEAEAEAFQAEIAAGAYGTVQLGLDYSPGYYLNGSRVQLDPDCRAIDAATGEALAGIVSTGMTYTYVAYRDTDQNGAIDILYYTDGVSDFVSAPLDQNAKIYAPGTLSDGKDSASSITGKYLAFADGVLEAAGRRDRQTYDRIVIGNTGRATYAADGKVEVSDPVLASINRERSLLWADDYGSIQTDYLYGMSSSTANWAQETFEAGDSKYNYELNMNYGLNAGLYATNGGQLTVGDLEGQTSYVETCGDTGNGIIAIGGGTYVGNRNAPYPTAAVYVYNTTFKCQGWNSHVADAIYGGYIYLEKVTGTTGMPGSYLGQSSALANDFGAGTLEAVDCDFTTYGNGSAGAYVIGQGSGTIKAINTNFTSYLDSGLCSAGGEFDITGGNVKGIIGFRARANGADSVLTNVALTKADVNTNYAAYVTDLENGIATEAAKAWAEATGDSGMPGPACSNLLVGVKGTTLGDLCDAYQVSRKARETLYETLSRLSGETYSDATPWRCSLLDSDRYGHPVADTGKLITAGTDYSEAPYLNNGVGAEGLQTSAVIEFQNAQLGLTLNNCTVSYEGDGNYNYLIASESKGCAQVTFNDCKNLTGIIWNEGDKASSDFGGINLGNSDMGGFVGSGSSYGVIVDFHGSSFAGDFADGDYGLWNVEGLRYTNGAGETSSLNGNYYGASANWGNCASFDGRSSWTVTGDSYLGSLTLEQGFTLSSEPGKSLEIYVGVDDSFNVATGTRVSSLEPGTYTAKDQFGLESVLLMGEGLDTLASAWGVAATTASGSGFAYHREGDQLVADITSQVYEDYIRQLHQWYEDGIVPRNFTELDTSNMSGTMEKELAADRTAIASTMVNSMDNLTNPDPDFELAPMVCTIDGGNIHSGQGERQFDSCSISTGCDEELIPYIMGWMNYWYTEEGAMAGSYGIQGVDYDYDQDGNIYYLEGITENEYGFPPMLYSRARCFSGASFGLMYQDRTVPFFTDAQTEAINVWTSRTDDLCAIPNSLGLNSEESDVVALYATDLATYISEEVPKFVTGDRSFDTWDEFVAECAGMHVDELLAAYQGAYNRYLTK